MIFGRRESFMNKENSPFTPGNPVPGEFFVGRLNQIKEILRYIKQSLSGKQENIFLIGERGIGKSSLAFLLRYLSPIQEDILTTHVFLGKVSTLEEMVRHIFEQLLKESKGQTWFNNIVESFGKYIQEVDLFGISVSFSPPEEELKRLVRNFPEALKNLLEKTKKKGLFIILDDINGLAEKSEFANWYKSFADEVATHYKDFPVSLMLIGLPEKRDTLSSLQPSLMRIFRVVEIEKLADEEVKTFLSNAFKKAGMKVESLAMDVMVKYSSGLPIIMHEIGDATFWLNEDEVVKESDALKGVVEAAKQIGKKYLDPKVYRAVRSKNYRVIMKQLGQDTFSRLSQHFTKSDIEARLSEKEKKVFHNFLTKLKKLGVIKSDLERGRGTYQFVNEIYPVYIWMESKN